PGFTVVPFTDLAAASAAVDDNTAGFLLEPVQGEGGVTPATQAFLKGLRALCDEQGLLLILDEVQCGYARTGTFFAHEQYGITPDIMAVAKGIGAGFPLGACLATEEAAKGMVFGTHGSTYGGNPLGMAAGLAVIDEVLGDGFLD
ncbi:MAG: aminotransferase class III-fold pyridoxal phosphate-dependent enzyme, partial [bacterium]|nr:aminotransferase class III-fold pyridoxal phosphate-dependent enzyme [bacterium]